MGAVVIVVVAPCCNQMAGMAQVWEQVLVQAFVPQAAVEAFDQAILHQLARRDVAPFHLAILLPFQHGVRRLLCTFVADPHSGEAPHLGDPVQFAATRCPDSEASTTVARHSRLKSSITQRMRNLRPSESASDTKSSDQRWFGP